MRVAGPHPLVRARSFVNAETQGHYSDIQSVRQASLGESASRRDKFWREEASRRSADNLSLAQRTTAMQLAQAPTGGPATPPAVPSDPPIASTSSLASPLPDQSPALSRREQVLEAVERSDNDSLRQFAADGAGFEDRELRRKVWCATVSPASLFVCPR